MNEQAGRSPAVSIGVLVNHFGSILLVKPSSDAEWQFPRVVQGWGETMIDAIERGVFEQTATKVKAGGIVQAYDLISEEADSHAILLDFDASYIDGALCAGEQIADVAWVSGLALKSMPVEENTLELLTDMEFM